jgi:hypothetical protein
MAATCARLPAAVGVLYSCGLGGRVRQGGALHSRSHEQCAPEQAARAMHRVYFISINQMPVVMSRGVMGGLRAVCSRLRERERERERERYCKVRAGVLQARSTQIST